jgi:hypothetical protein
LSLSVTKGHTILAISIALAAGSCGRLTPSHPFGPVDSSVAIIPGVLRSAEKTRELPWPVSKCKLAAILAADVVGYSRLMGREESSTLLARANEVIE